MYIHLLCRVSVLFPRLTLSKPSSRQRQQMWEQHSHIRLGYSSTPFWSRERERDRGYELWLELNEIEAKTACFQRDQQLFIGEKFMTIKSTNQIDYCNDVSCRYCTIWTREIIDSDLDYCRCRRWWVVRTERPFSTREPERRRERNEVRRHCCPLRRSGRLL